jgi:hypothetical protein
MLFCKPTPASVKLVGLLLSGRSEAWLSRLVRDQEVGGSNPLAPTTFKTLPFIGLRNLFCFNPHYVLWTNVDQLKAQADSFSPFLAERYVVF